MRQVFINWTETPRAQNAPMRWIIVIVVLFAFDRFFLHGQLADQAWSVVQSIGLSLNTMAQDLLQPLRR